MPDASVLFEVPAAVDGVVSAVLDHGGQSPDFPSSEEADLSQGLATRIGETVNIEFESAEDPLEAICDMSSTLDAAGVRYWATSDAFEERSRGLRVSARIFIGDGRARREFSLAWEDGPPEFDERTLRAAGVPEDDAADLVRWAFPDPSPASGP